MRIYCVNTLIVHEIRDSFTSKSALSPGGRKGQWQSMDEEWARFLRRDFVQGFPAYCGYEVDLVGDGEFHTSLKVRPDHRQQDGFVHAGVIATMADHSAGYAAFTTVTAESRILTIEFKINYFRPATDETIVCRSKVINRGKKIIVSESEVFSVSGEQERLVSKALVTLMAVPATSLAKAETEDR